VYPRYEMSGIGLAMKAMTG